MVVRARQSLYFLRQNTWFLGKNRAFSKFLYQILHLFNDHYQSLKQQSIKTNHSLFGNTFQ